MKRTPQSRAIARASVVLPVPGGPANSMPRSRSRHCSRPASASPISAMKSRAKCCASPRPCSSSSRRPPTGSTERSRSETVARMNSSACPGSRPKRWGCSKSKECTWRTQCARVASHGTGGGFENSDSKSAAKVSGSSGGRVSRTSVTRRSGSGRSVKRSQPMRALTSRATSS